MKTSVEYALKGVLAVTSLIGLATFTFYLGGSLYFKERAPMWRLAAFFWVIYGASLYFLVRDIWRGPK